MEMAKSRLAARVAGRLQVVVEPGGDKPHVFQRVRPVEPSMPDGTDRWGEQSRRIASFRAALIGFPENFCLVFLGV
jgi:hypothetical protein